MILNNTRPFIAGNWKMHKTAPEAAELTLSLKRASGDFNGAEVVVIPPFPALPEVVKTARGSLFQVGAQNLFWEAQGAYTGEVSAPMLKAVGCRFVVIGHSERRQHFGETNEAVNRKIKAALSSDLIPIMCLGESLEEREKGETIKKVETQLAEGLRGLDVDEFKTVIIAYEPIWAIGTGLTATPDQAQEVHSFMRDKLAEAYGQQTATYAIILYGGSVKPENAYSLLKEKDINGALVGGASLKADSFGAIIKESLRAYKDK